MLFLFVSLNAQSPLEKRIDFSVHRLPVKNALRQLSLESKINIAYSSDFFNKKKRVSVNVKNESIENILLQVLEDSNVKYELIDEQIVVTSTKPKEKKRYTISGYVEDESSGERLISVTIYSPDHQEGTTTNEYGFYSITLPEGETELRVRYIGCEEVRRKIQLTRDHHASIKLKPTATLSEVVIIGNANIAVTEPLFDTHNESITKIGQLPILGRGDDLIKQINFLPGVETGVDGLGGMFVRGGNIDQNLTLMDGVSIYNPSHLLGIFSVYNSSAIKSSKLYKGDFPARYGGRISSVLDVRTKDGNTQKFSGEINPGLLSSRLTLEGPILKDKIGFFATSRFSHIRGLLNLTNNTIAAGDEIPANLQFYDLNLKLHYSISKKDKVFLSFYAGQDIFTVNDVSVFRRNAFINIDSFPLIIDSAFQQTKVNWGNSIFSLRWNHLHNNKLFSNTTITYSKFNFNLADLQYSKSFVNDTLVNFDIKFLQYENYIHDVGMKMDFDYIPSSKHYFRFGLGVIGRRFSSGNTDEYIDIEDLESPPDDPNFSEYVEAYATENFYSSYDFNAYVEDEIKISESLKANVGLRVSLFGNNSNNWFGSIEPRIKIIYALSNRWSVNASINRTSQSLHLLTNTGLGLPIDVWIPSLEEIRPQTAWQETIGFEYRSPKDFKFKMEAYHKKMKHLIFLEESIFRFESLSLSDSTFIKGTGTSYGLEFTLEKEYKKIAFYAYYTLSKSERLFPQFNLGNSFPFQYDRRHSLKVAGLWKATKKMNIGLGWTYFTGTPRIFSDIFETITDDIPFEEEPFAPGKFNGRRTPAYHRLDFKIDFTFRKKYGIHRLGFSIYNLTFRKNVTFYERIPQIDNQGNFLGYIEDPIVFAPIIPSLNYSFKF
ncbi:MAG: TonB-dependent receptor [Saprospiraceae bacterium]